MTVVPLAVLYAVVGLGCAAAWLAARSRPGAALAAPGRRLRAAADAVLLACLWPLYGPFLLLLDTGAESEAHRPGAEAAFLAALRRAGDTPLGAVLPDQAAARELAARLRVAAAKVHEIDDILTRPAFDEADARRRLAALRARASSDCAISTATMRLHNIHRLRTLRNRFGTELDEVGELIIQLTTQAEVVRLAGTPEDVAPGTPVAELVRELVARVEGLDEVLDDRVLDDRVLGEPRGPRAMENEGFGGQGLAAGAELLDARPHGPDSHCR